MKSAETIITTSVSLNRVSSARPAMCMLASATPKTVTAISPAS